MTEESSKNRPQIEIDLVNIDNEVINNDPVDEKIVYLEQACTELQQRLSSDLFISQQQGDSNVIQKRRDKLEKLMKFCIELMPMDDAMFIWLNKIQ